MTSVSGTRWDLEIKIGIPIVAILILACFGAAVWFYIWGTRSGHAGTDQYGPYRADDDDRKLGHRLGYAGVGLAVIIAAVAAIAYFPWQAQYHQYRVITGTVAATSSRLMQSDDGKSVNQRILVKMRNDDLLYGCDDTRCTGLQPGDSVRLICKLSYQYASTPGEVCRWGGAE